MAEEILQKTIRFPYTGIKGDLVSETKIFADREGGAPVYEFSAPNSVADTLYDRLINDYYAKRDKQLERKDTRGTYLGLQEPFLKVRISASIKSVDILKSKISKEEMDSVYKIVGNGRLRNRVCLIQQQFGSEVAGHLHCWENGYYLKCESAYYVIMKKGNAELWHGNKHESTITFKGADDELLKKSSYFLETREGLKVISDEDLECYLREKVLSPKNIRQLRRDIIENFRREEFSSFLSFPLERSIFQDEIFRKDYDRDYHNSEPCNLLLARYGLFPSPKEALQLPPSIAPLGAREAARQQYAINNPRLIVKPLIPPEKPSESQSESKAQSRGRGR